MTNQQHPITPPLELLDKWDNLPLSTQEIFVIVAQWGADQELEACCELLEQEEWDSTWIPVLRAARRPKPPSLKEQALEALEVEDDAMPLRSLERSERFDTIRRALEALPE